VRRGGSGCFKATATCHSWTALEHPRPWQHEDLIAWGRRVDESLGPQSLASSRARAAPARPPSSTWEWSEANRITLNSSCGLDQSAARLQHGGASDERPFRGRLR
jgi:hypothetical protein